MDLNPIRVDDAGNPVVLDALVELARHPKFVGIGESGLDYHYTAESKSIQQESLRIHIEAARSVPLWPMTATAVAD